jgi:hypothetical protein
MSSTGNSSLVDRNNCPINRIDNIRTSYLLAGSRNHFCHENATRSRFIVVGEDAAVISTIFIKKIYNNIKCYDFSLQTCA